MRNLYNFFDCDCETCVRKQKLIAGDDYINPKLCELREYTYRKGMQLKCSVLECEKNNKGICKEFKEEK